MSHLEVYATKHLADEILVIEATGRKNELPQLSVFEKAIIYKYSNDGFWDVNAELRISKGKTISEFAEYLDAALGNCPVTPGWCIEKYT